jgi:hypothetical protein
LQRYSVEFNVSIDFSSDLENKIFVWLSAHSKPGVDQIGSLYESVYFFDTQFWAVSIQIIFGEVSLNPFDSLSEIPESIKNEIMFNKQLTELRISRAVLDLMAVAKLHRRIVIRNSVRLRRGAATIQVY